MTESLHQGPRIVAFRVELVAKWRVFKPDNNTTAWVSPGWYLYTGGERPRYVPISGWRLWRHRILWGFGHGLVDAR